MASIPPRQGTPEYEHWRHHRTSSLNLTNPPPEATGVATCPQGFKWFVKLELRDPPLEDAPEYVWWIQPSDQYGTGYHHVTLYQGGCTLTPLKGTMQTLFLPALRDIPDPKMPKHDDELLLYIDNNKDALSNVLQFVDNHKPGSPESAAEEFRKHLYDPIFGPSAAIRRGAHPEDNEHLHVALQELLDTDEPYARSYTYWQQVMQHYRTISNERWASTKPAGLETKKAAPVVTPAPAAIPAPKASAGKRVITDEVKAVLERATFRPEAKCVDLPKGDLGPLYEQVATVMLDYGGKWKTGKKTHVFPSSADVLALRQALETGVAVNQRTKKQAFYTPEALAKQMVDILQIKAGDLVLEPSAGHGVLAKAAYEAGGLVDCIENDPEAVRWLWAFNYPVISDCDFLTIPPLAKYDKVIMNPPFTKGQDIKHVLHAFEFLKPGGVLVSVMSSSVLTATTKAAQQFREVLNKHGSAIILAHGTFKKSGTNVATSLITLRKPKE